MSEIDDYMVPDEVPEPRTATTLSEISLERGLPASVDAERTILGAILLDNQAFNEAAESLTADDFSLDSHRILFKTIEGLIDANVAVDIVTLSDELERLKALETIGNRAYIFSLTENLPRRLSIEDYVRIVKDKSMLRQVMGICSLAQSRCADQSEAATSVLESTEEALLEIAQQAAGRKLRTILDSVRDVGGVDAYMKPILDPEIRPGLPTHYYDFDRMTGGFQKSELVIIAARPSVGKTAWAINIMENVGVGDGKVIAFFSLEMSREAVEKRFMASRARVNVRRAMEGEFISQDERTKLTTALGELMEARVFIDDSSSMTPTQLRAKCRRLKQREGRIDLVVIDYLQLMSAGHKVQNRQEEIAYVSRSLKALAKELEAPVVALAQLNRSNEQRQDKRPVLSDMRESGQIEQDADLVAFLHRDEMYQPDNEDVQGLADIIIAKQRNGPTGIVKMVYIKECCRFETAARR